MICTVILGKAAERPQSGWRFNVWRKQFSPHSISILAMEVNHRLLDCL
jgi:hypothetical protein